MYECHINAVLLRPGVIMGQELRPFTLGHAFLLEAQDSPFICGGAVEFADLVFAVVICSMPWEEARALVMDERRLIKAAAKWGRRVGRKKYDIKEACAEFATYIKSYFDTVDVLEDPEKKADPCPTALPIAARMAWALMERMTEAEAWACPMGKALMYCVAKGEESGQKYMPEEWQKIADSLPEGPEEA